MRGLPGGLHRGTRRRRRRAGRIRPRNAATAKIVLANRSTPPDTILREVHERSGDKPFARLEDVVSREALEKIAGNYRQVAGMTPGADATRTSP